jgi:hypothetical protein
MKVARSTVILSVLFLAILAISLYNTALIVHNNNALQEQRNKDVNNLNQSISQAYSSLNQSDYALRDLLNGRIDNLDARLPIEQYDYVISRSWDYKSNSSVYLLKNGRNGTIERSSQNAALVFDQALQNGNTVFVKSDKYELDADILVVNKKNARLDSDGSTLNLKGNKIALSGFDFAHSQNNQVSGFIIVNGTLRIKNSFRTTVTNMIFENSTVGLELMNSNTWTEGTKIDNVHFNRCSQGIVFRSNTTETLTDRSTGSYGNTAITRSYFNQLDNSVAITIEENAEFTDGQLQNVRIWIGEFGNYNQTGLLLRTNSSMCQTLLTGVVFESFANGSLAEASINAVKIEEKVYGSPVLQGGVSFLGAWTARVDNYGGNWLTGVGSAFKKENIPIVIDPFEYASPPRVIHVSPAMITSIRPAVIVEGEFVHNETVTVRFMLEFVDNAVSEAVEKSFNSSTSLWLNDEDLFKLFPSQNMIYALLVDAKISSIYTDVSVQVSVYGTST